jgi:hypothetical protein
MDMISDLDEVLRQLLIRELPVKNGEVDIDFDQPAREWSSRLTKPTLNLFLHDIRENNTLREADWDIRKNGDGTYSRLRKPLRVDLRYMITAWANEPEDEHRLLTRTLIALYRCPTLPEDLLSESLEDQPYPIPVQVAHQEELRTPADIWSALDNELRAAIACVVTLSLNPYKEITGPLVRTRDLRLGPATDPTRRQLEADTEQDRFWMVGGTVRSDKPLDEMQVSLVERGLTVPVAEDGRFIIGNLEEGDYTLEIAAGKRKPRRHKITVPAADYDIEM